MKVLDKQVDILGYLCRVVITRYADGNKAMILEDSIDGSRVAVASVNMGSDVDLADDEIVIKNWTEHEGVLEKLVEAGIVQETGKFVELPFNQAPICRIIAS